MFTVLSSRYCHYTRVRPGVFQLRRITCLKRWTHLFCSYCSLVFTVQCTLVQSAVLRSHVIRLSVRPFVCLSVCLSVTLVICDHIGWKSWKLIARTISRTHSLFAAKGRSTYSQGTWGNFWETRGGVVKKWHAGEQKRQYLLNAKR